MKEYQSMNSERNFKRIKGKLITLILVIAVVTSSGDIATMAYDSSQGKGLSIKTIFETEGYSQVAGDDTTPLITYNGNTYFVWNDESRRPFLSKISSAGTIETYPLDSNEDYVAKDDGHHKYSIGIDKNGYIHVTGDMHNYPNNSSYDDYLPNRYKNKIILYWVSDNAEDISGFTFKGGDGNHAMTGTGFTYGKFYNDSNMELYYLSRVRSSTAGHFYGEMGVGLYKYDPITMSWNALGGYAPSSPAADYKTLVWEDNGHLMTNFYQMYIVSMLFDENNRMHIAVGINNNNDEGMATDILYAYSDDGGATFSKADGTGIANLPMRAEAGDNQATLVTSTGEYWPSVHVFLDPNGNPGVVYSEFADGSISVTGDFAVRKGTEYKVWDPSSGVWKGGIQSLTGSWFRERAITGPDGITTFIPNMSTKIVRTNKLGVQGYIYDLGMKISPSIDMLHLKNTGNIKTVVLDDGSMKVVELIFDEQVDSSIVYMSDLDCSTWEGDNVPQKDSNINGGTIKLKGIEYSKGIGLSGDSTITYNLGQHYSLFRSEIGIDDIAGGGGNVIFKIYLDGELAYYSSNVDGLYPTKNIMLDVTGVNVLELDVSDGGDGVTGDYAVWANARLETGVSGVPTGELKSAEPNYIYSVEKYDDYPVGTKLNTASADTYKGWSSGWMSDSSLQTALDDSYVVSEGNVYERINSGTMFRGVVNDIDMSSDETYYIGYNIKVNDPVHVTSASRARLYLDNSNYFGFSAIDGVTSDLNLNLRLGGNTTATGVPVDKGEEYSVLAKISAASSGLDTVQLKMYASGDSIPMEEPSSWDLTQTADIDTVFDAVGLEGALYYDGEFAFSNIRYTKNWTALFADLPIEENVQRIEAEHMTISGTGAAILNNSFFSYGQGVALVSNLSTVGNIGTIYSGQDGTYDIKIAYIDNGNGDNEYNLNVNGQQVGSFKSDNSPIGTYKEVEANLVSTTISGISLLNGDEIGIEVLKDGLEKGTVDYIEITESSDLTEEYFDYPVNTELNTTDSDIGNGWSSGWKADTSLNDELDSSYVVSQDYSYQRINNGALYRGVTRSIDLSADDTYFISYKIKVDDPVHVTFASRARLYLDNNNFFGFSAVDGVTSDLNLNLRFDGNTIATGTAIEKGIEYTVVLKLTAVTDGFDTAQVKLYSAEDIIPENEPVSWDLTQTAETSLNFGALGFEGNLYDNGTFVFDDLRYGSSFIEVTQSVIN